MMISGERASDFHRSGEVMEKLAAETESDQVPLRRPVSRQHARRSHCFFGSVADLKRVHGIGTTKPQAPMLSAIWRIYFFECVRALRGLGLSSSGETYWISCMS